MYESFIVSISNSFLKLKNLIMILSTMKISLTRFKWKPAPWMNPQNVRSIWVYSSGGNLEFEFEIDPSIDLNQEAHAKHSKNKNQPNFVQITEPTILRIIE